MNTHEIIIVGAGPAGLATALHLAQQAPALAAETLIIEAKDHPRPKLCGGGVTFHGEKQLDHLGLAIDVQAFDIHRLEFRLGTQSFVVPYPKAMRIFERAQFDHALAQEVATQGIAFRTGERLLDLQVVDGGVELTTDRDRYQARVVVAADGANSTVRRKLGMFHTAGVARLLRIMTRIDPDATPAWQDHTAVFDFSCVQNRVQGYMWDFPCFVGGQPFMNRGIFDSRIMPQPFNQRQHGHFKQTFAAALQDRNVDMDAVPLEGHPVRWFNPQAEFSRPHILLVGDAAGVDPLFAEGISYAMEYGAIATEMIQAAFAHKDFTFTGYRSRLLDHRLGQMLMRRAGVARQLYRYRYPFAWSILWHFASIAPRRVQRAMGAALALLPP